MKKSTATVLAFAMMLLLVDSVTPSQAQIDSLSKLKKWIPNVNGVIRAKFEYNFSVDKGRFDVRNARFGMRNTIGNHFGYKFEIDFCDEGKIKMLDAYVSFIPVKNLSLTLGQMKATFSTEYMLSPADFEFSNRPFIDKRICKDLRDIGFRVGYKYEGKVPFEVMGTIMNGNGFNNPEWTSRFVYGGRAIAGPFKGFSVQLNYMAGIINDFPAEMQDYGLRYEYKNLVINSEYAQKTVTDTTGSYTQNSLFIYTLYRFYFKKGMLKDLVPAIRYDFFSQNMKSGILEPQRLTVGLTLGFDKINFANIRFNYEKYFYRTQEDPDDKFTIELIARF
ncbi:MAG TPA: porin [Bacteroidales bacterium]|nr:porin [Bacteroidales bacterium]